MKKIFNIFLMALTATSCANSGSEPRPNTAQANQDTVKTVGATLGSFAYDLNFLKTHDSALVHLRRGDAQLLASAQYQGKVFTSTADGLNGHSFGWVNYRAFEGAPGLHMNAYGGENRLWLGPEGGKFSLFFHPGAKMEFSNWKTPPGFDSEPWELASQNDTVVSFRKNLLLINYAGTTLSIRIDRAVTLLDNRAIDSLLNIHLSGAVRAVGYRTENGITNTGSRAWDETTGMPCIWMLDMFPPTDSTTIVAPFKPGTLPAATTDYFGKIPLDRLRYRDGALFFKADGKKRGKLGVHPNRALPMAGSYDAVRHILTIILYDQDPLGRYLNQEWNTAKPPFSGDAMNAYNDGPLADGTQMGPFYELESVGAAAFLPPGHKATHWHSVFHFTGPDPALDAIARSCLSTSLQTITTIFH